MFQKILILIMLLFSYNLCVQAENTFTTITPMKCYNHDFSDISALEKYSMNKIYKRDNIVNRIERLEELAFGSIQSGNINQRYHNVKNAILSRPQQYNNKYTLLKTLGNYLNGQMTGYTPTLDYNQYIPANSQFYTPYNSNYMPSFHNINTYPNDFGYKNYTTTTSPFGNGYRRYNSSYGTTSSIKILD